MNRNRGYHNKIPQTETSTRHGYSDYFDYIQSPLNHQERDIMYQQPSSNHSFSSSLTDEQRAFESEFSKWEKSFSDWQNSYANHPDRLAYKQYEEKFLQVRDKLLTKRAQIYGRKQTEHRLENELGAATAMADSILSKFGEPEQRFGRHSGNFQPQPLMGGDFYGVNRFPRQDRSRSPYFSRDSYGGGMKDSRRERRNQRGQKFLNNRDGNRFEKLGNQAKASGTSESTEDQPARRRRRLRRRPKNNDAKPVEKVDMTQKYKELLEEAKKTEFPRMLSGASTRKLTNLRKKRLTNPSSLTEEDKAFIEYAEYCWDVRRKHYDEKRKAEAEAESKEPAEESKESAESTETSEVAKELTSELGVTDLEELTAEKEEALLESGALIESEESVVQVQGTEEEKILEEKEAPTES